MNRSTAPAVLLAFGLLSLPVARAEPIPDDHLADIVANHHVAATPDAVLAMASDLQVQEELLGDCTRRWEHGSLTKGPGASATLVYKVGVWRRKLSATVTEVTPGRRVVVDHAGDKGFITVWTALDTAEGTDVELRTLLNLPVRPFRKVFVNNVQERWQACYADALIRLDARLR